jgi:hypothetical protein
MSYLQDLAATDEQKRLQNIQRQKVRDDHIANGRAIPWGYQADKDFATPPPTSPWKQEYSDRLGGAVGSGPLTQWSMDSQNTQEQRDPNTGQVVPFRPAPVLTNGAAPILTQGTAPVTAPGTTPDPVLTGVPGQEKNVPPQSEDQVPAPALETPDTAPQGSVEETGKEPWQMSFAEKMGRYGGNGLKAKGGRAAVGSMGSTTAEIFEAERAQNQQIEENEVARMAKLKTSSAALDQLEQMRAMDNTKSKFDSALAGFIKYGDTVTGPLDSRYQAFKDSSGLPLPGGAPADPERAAFVLSLKDIIVNDTLLKTAMTKGAISNAEMALFQQGIPNMDQQEAVWISWLTARRQNIEMIQDRIRNGTRVGLDSGVGFANAYTAPGSGSSSPASSAPSALTQAQLDAMAKNTPK